jgi:hypothetical protein
MSDSEEKNVSKVRETSLGSLTQTPEDPFARRARVARSPVRVTASSGQSSALPPGPTAVTVKTPLSSARGEKNLEQPKSPDEKALESAREIVEAELKRMRENLLNMSAVTLRQKNISNEIKNGLVELERSLDVVDSMRRVWSVSSTRMAESMTASRQTQTPIPSQGPGFSGDVPKRPASSPPLAEREEKRPKESESGSQNDDGFTNVLSKKERKKAKVIAKRAAASEAKSVPTPRPASTSKKKGGDKVRKSRPRKEVVLIKPSAGKTYSEILGAMKTGLVPENSGTVVRQVRKTAAGGVLMELTKCSDRAKLQQDIRNAVGVSGDVRSIVPRLRVEVLDLDSLTSETEVTEALKKEFPSLTSELKATLFKPNRREQRKALVEMDEKEALSVLRKGKLKVGWVVCRVRQRLEVERCFKCLGYGHMRKNCPGPDRSKNCWKCGSTQHKAADCKDAPSCALCTDTPGEGYNHIPGSGACRAFKKALQAKKALPRK